jgi:hypothetical protein
MPDGVASVLGESTLGSSQKCKAKRVVGHFLWSLRSKSAAPVVPQCTDGPSLFRTCSTDGEQRVALASYIKESHAATMHWQDQTSATRRQSKPPQEAQAHDQSMQAIVRPSYASSPNRDSKHMKGSCLRLSTERERKREPT